MPKRLLTKTVGCMTPHKTTNGSKLPASSHCKRTPMRISFGPSSSDSEGESDSDSGSNASEVVAPCRSTAAAGGEGGRVVSLTERLQVRKEVESSSGCKNGASDVPSKAPPSSRAPAAVPNLRTPLLSVGNIDTQNSRYSNSSNSNNNSLVGASVDNRSLKRRDGAALGKGFSRERSISIRTSSPRCVINALDGVNDAATTCATAMDNSIDLSRSSELEDHRSVSSSPSLSPPSQHWQSSSQSARKRNSINNVEGSSSAGRFSCQSNMSGGGNARLYPASTTPVAVSRAFHSPSNVPFTNMVDSIDLTGVGSDSENQRSPGGKLPKHTRNGRQGGSAGGVEKIGAVAASATMACRRGGGRYSIDSVSSVDLVVDENDGADGRYAGKNNDDDNFVFEDCHGDEVRRESDNEGNPGVASYHSSQSSDNSSILSKSSRKKGANGRSEFSVVPAPRISMGAAAAAAAAGSGRGSRYDGGGEACDWRPAAAGSSRWELEAEGGNGTPFSVPASLYDRMYPHQREGVKWLWRLHQEETGGILGDDMGLGKTFQVCCLLGGLFSTKQASCALILAPKSVLRGWEVELQAWFVKACCRSAEVYVVASEMSVRARRLALRTAALGGALGRGAVVVCTYGIVSANPTMFDPLKGDGNGHKWDYVVLDEGHKIKNPSTKISKAVHLVPAKRRLVLSGTPVQNNLRELHTVVDWATFGSVLGRYEDFKKSFQHPIENGQDKNASEYVIKKSKSVTHELRRLLAPHLLQRHKGEIMDEKVITKTEMVVWVALSKEQREIYAEYLGGASVMDVLSGEVTSPLAAIQHLKKVCLHPMVSSFPLNQPWYLDRKEPVKRLVRGSPKLAVFLKLVSRACDEGHRVLVFSRFIRMLDIIQRCLEADRSEGGAGVSRVSRIDGSSSDLERQQTIKSFNGSTDIPVCLVSTGAGGTGITLTGADRVVLFDPSWNPADDMQAVDRAYRIGQTKDVVVYRMIAAGTVEEKMYEKQVFKDGLRRTIMGGSDKRKKSVRYFSRKELQQLFTLFPSGECRVLDQLEEMHGTLRARLQATNSASQRALAAAGGHLDFLTSLRGLYGASAHADGLPKVVCQSLSVPVASEDEYESAAEEYDGEWLPPARGGGGGGGGGTRAGARSRGGSVWLEDDADEHTNPESDTQKMSMPTTGGRRRIGVREARGASLRGSDAIELEVITDSDGKQEDGKFDSGPRKLRRYISTSDDASDESADADKFAAGEQDRSSGHEVQDFSHDEQEEEFEDAIAYQHPVAPTLADTASNGRSPSVASSSRSSVNTHGYSSPPGRYSAVSFEADDNDGDHHHPSSSSYIYDMSRDGDMLMSPVSIDAVGSVDGCNSSCSEVCGEEVGNADRPSSRMSRESWSSAVQQQKEEQGEELDAAVRPSKEQQGRGSMGAFVELSNEECKFSDVDEDTGVPANFSTSLTSEVLPCSPAADGTTKRNDSEDWQAAGMRDGDGDEEEKEEGWDGQQLAEARGLTVLPEPIKSALFSEAQDGARSSNNGRLHSGSDAESAPSSEAMAMITDDEQQEGQKQQGKRAEGRERAKRRADEVTGLSSPRCSSTSAVSPTLSSCDGRDDPSDVDGDHDGHDDNRRRCSSSSSNSSRIVGMSRDDDIAGSAVSAEAAGIAEREDEGDWQAEGTGEGEDDDDDDDDDEEGGWDEQYSAGTRRLTVLSKPNKSALTSETPNGARSSNNGRVHSGGDTESAPSSEAMTMMTDGEQQEEQRQQGEVTDSQDEAKRRADEVTGLSSPRGSITSAVSAAAAASPTLSSCDGRDDPSDDDGNRDGHDDDYRRRRRRRRHSSSRIVGMSRDDDMAGSAVSAEAAEIAEREDEGDWQVEGTGEGEDAEEEDEDEEGGWDEQYSAGTRRLTVLSKPNKSALFSETPNGARSSSNGKVHSGGGNESAPSSEAMTMMTDDEQQEGQRQQGEVTDSQDEAKRRADEVTGLSSPRGSSTSAVSAAAAASPTLSSCDGRDDPSDDDGNRDGHDDDYRRRRRRHSSSRIVGISRDDDMAGSAVSAEAAGIAEREDEGDWQAEGTGEGEDAEEEDEEEEGGWDEQYSAGTRRLTVLSKPNKSALFSETPNGARSSNNGRVHSGGGTESAPSSEAMTMMTDDEQQEEQRQQGEVTDSQDEAKRRADEVTGLSSPRGSSTSAVSAAAAASPTLSSCDGRDDPSDDDGNRDGHDDDYRRSHRRRHSSSRIVGISRDDDMAGSAVSAEAAGIAEREDEGDWQAEGTGEGEEDDEEEEGGWDEQYSAGTRRLTVLSKPNKSALFSETPNDARSSSNGMVHSGGDTESAPSSEAMTMMTTDEQQEEQRQQGEVTDSQDEAKRRADEATGLSSPRGSSTSAVSAAAAASPTLSSCDGRDDPSDDDGNCDGHDDYRRRRRRRHSSSRIVGISRDDDMAGSAVSAEAAGIAEREDEGDWQVEGTGEGEEDDDDDNDDDDEDEEEDEDEEGGWDEQYSAGTRRLTVLSKPIKSALFSETPNGARNSNNGRVHSGGDTESAPSSEAMTMMPDDEQQEEQRQQGEVTDSQDETKRRADEVTGLSSPRGSITSAVSAAAAASPTLSSCDGRDDPSDDDGIRDGHDDDYRRSRRRHSSSRIVGISRDDDMAGSAVSAEAAGIAEREDERDWQVEGTEEGEDDDDAEEEEDDADEENDEEDEEGGWDEQYSAGTRRLTVLSKPIKSALFSETPNDARSSNNGKNHSGGDTESAPSSEAMTMMTDGEQQEEQRQQGEVTDSQDEAKRRADEVTGLSSPRGSSTSAVSAAAAASPTLSSCDGRDDPSDDDGNRDGHDDDYRRRRRRHSSSRIVGISRDDDMAGSAVSAEAAGIAEREDEGDWQVEGTGEGEEDDDEEGGWDEQYSAGTRRLTVLSKPNKSALFSETPNGARSSSNGKVHSGGGTESAPSSEAMTMMTDDEQQEGQRQQGEVTDSQDEAKRRADEVTGLSSPRGSSTSAVSAAAAASPTLSSCDGRDEEDEEEDEDEEGGWDEQYSAGTRRLTVLSKPIKSALSSETLNGTRSSNNGRVHSGGDTESAPSSEAMTMMTDGEQQEEQRQQGRRSGSDVSVAAAASPTLLSSDRRTGWSDDDDGGDRFIFKQAANTSRKVEDVYAFREGVGKFKHPLGMDMIDDSDGNLVSSDEVGTGKDDLEVSRSSKQYGEDGQKEAWCGGEDDARMVRTRTAVEGEGDDWHFRSASIGRSEVGANKENRADIEEYHSVLSMAMGPRQSETGRRKHESSEVVVSTLDDGDGDDVVDSGDGESASVEDPEGERRVRRLLPLPLSDVSKSLFVASCSSNRSRGRSSSSSRDCDEGDDNSTSAPAATTTAADQQRPAHERSSSPSASSSNDVRSPIVSASVSYLSAPLSTITNTLSPIADVPTASCREHVEVLKRYGFKSFQCRCKAGPAAQERSQGLLRSSLKKEAAGQLHKAMDACLTAIELCDDDRELHEAVCRIATKIAVNLP